MFKDFKDVLKNMAIAVPATVAMIYMEKDLPSPDSILGKVFSVMLVFLICFISRCTFFIMSEALWRRKKRWVENYRPDPSRFKNSSYDYNDARALSAATFVVAGVLWVIFWYKYYYAVASLTFLACSLIFAIAFPIIQQRMWRALP